MLQPLKSCASGIVHAPQAIPTPALLPALVSIGWQQWGSEKQKPQLK